MCIGARDREEPGDRGGNGSIDSDVCDINITVTTGVASVAIVVVAVVIFFVALPLAPARHNVSLPLLLL